MAETIDQQFIEYIVKALVGKPDEVKVERRIDEKGVLLELYVAAEDLGRVIGRNGGTAKSIRTLLRALGVKNDARYNLKIVDTNSGGQRPGQPVEEPPEQVEEQAVEEAAAEATPVASAPDDVTADDATTADDSAADDDSQDEDQTDKKPASSVDRHREDLKDLTDFDI